MKLHSIMLAAIVGVLGFVAPVSAGVVLYAEGPSSVSAGTEVAIRLKAKLTESVNALKTTVTVRPADAGAVRFDDSNSVIRLWLQRGVPVAGGVVLEGVIPGGVGPAFTDVVELGTLWVRPAAEGTLRIAFSDSVVYLNQPTPTLSDVSSAELTLRVSPADSGTQAETLATVVIDSDVRIVSEVDLFDGKRTLVFDIKTDRGTVDTVRVRERWLGVWGTWRDAVSPSTLSDSWGVSILDVVLSDTEGGSRVATVVPVLLKIIWGLVALGVIAVVMRYLKHRH